MPDAPIRKPWLGERWEQNRLLILGESHYHYPGEDPDDVEKTIETVRTIIDGRSLPFFTALERAVTGASRDAVDPADFYQTVAFANFCQGSADGAAGAKTPEMWRRGIDALPIILREIKPKRMLVFSAESWRRFSRLDGLTWRHERNIELGGYSEDTGFLESPDGVVKVYCMNVGHPSGWKWHGDGPDGWHPFIADFLKHPTESDTPV